MQRHAERSSGCATQLVLGVMGILAIELQAPLALALGVVEIPGSGRTQTGIGLVSGWHCNGKLIQIQIDGGELLTAASRTPRGDTVAVCGRSDTGFGLLLNYNLLDRGSHELIAYADGVEFARTSFRTTNFGIPYLRDRTAFSSVLNFPEVGREAILQWQEEKQGFSVVSTGAAPAIAGRYHGAAVEKRDCFGEEELVRHATFTVGYADARLSLTAQYADGGSCSFSAPAQLGSDGYLRTSSQNATSTCSFPGDFTLRVNGEQIVGFGIYAPCFPLELHAAK